MSTHLIPRRPLGKTNFQVSVLGFGSAPIGYLKTDIERAGRVMSALLDGGANLIDTAANYPGSEAAIAQTVIHRRDQFVLVSKCGTKLAGVSGTAWSAELIEQTVDRSLQTLKIDTLDVMLLHSCDLETLQKGEAVGALAKACQAGKIRFAGYSGDNEAAAYAVTLPDIAVLETSVNITDQVNINHALPLALKNNVGVLAKRPVANAAWKKLSDQEGLYQNYAKIYTERFQAMGLTLEQLGFSGDPQIVWPEIALRFTLSQPDVDCAIVGTTNPQNMAANFDYAAKGPLPALAVDIIRSAFATAELASGNAWPGQM